MCYGSNIAWLYELQLLNRMLVVEEQFVQAYRAATTLLPPHQRVQLTPLTEALVNDYAVSIARCVSYDRNLKVRCLLRLKLCLLTYSLYFF